MPQFRVSPRKITQYLLTVDPAATPEAKGKSRFFHGIGYDAARWATLHDALVRHPLTAQHEWAGVTDYGLKVVYRCSMSPAPNGGAYCIRTVWMLRADGIYWLSTAYPQT